MSTSSKLSRRSALKGIAAIPAIATPVAVSAACVAPDPIFAAIENYRVTYDAFGEVLTAIAPLESSIPGERQRWSATPYEPTPPAGNNDDPRWIEAKFKERDASHANLLALKEFVTTEPTTVAGAAAAAAFISECRDAGDNFDGTAFVGRYDDNGEPIYLEVMDTFFETLASALQRMAGNEA